jgi:hypothetical protein
MKRSRIKETIKQEGVNGLIKAQAETAEERARAIAAAAITSVLTSFGHAMEKTLVEDYGFGDKRINRFYGQLNKRLPDHLQITTEPSEYIKRSDLEDLISFLLEIGCNQRDCVCKDYMSCKLHKALVVRGIEPYDPKAIGCPYKITHGQAPEHFTEAQLNTLHQILEDRYKREVK